MCSFDLWLVKWAGMAWSQGCSGEPGEPGIVGLLVRTPIVGARISLGCCLQLCSVYRWKVEVAGRVELSLSVSHAVFYPVRHFPKQRWEFHPAGASQSCDPRWDMSSYAEWVRKRDSGKDPKASTEPSLDA